MLKALVLWEQYFGCIWKQVCSCICLLGPSPQAIEPRRWPVSKPGRSALGSLTLAPIVVELKRLLTARKQRGIWSSAITANKDRHKRSLAIWVSPSRLTHGGHLPIAIDWCLLVETDREHRLEGATRCWRKSDRGLRSSVSAPGRSRASLCGKMFRAKSSSAVTRSPSSG